MESSALLRRLGDDVALWDLEVTESGRITASMQRIRCTAPRLDHFSYLPGQDLMLAVPGNGSETFRRRYTIRRVVPSEPSIDLDIVLHGDGPGARWASTVQPGDHIEAIGPRGKITVEADADWHLFIGDDSGIPASLAMSESLGASQRGLVILEVDGPEDRHESIGSAGDVSVEWLYRDGGDPASADHLLEHLRGLALPSGRGHAYLAGELKVVAALRSLLLDRGLAAEQVSSKPYWRAGVANAAHGEPERE
jgi:NADPH-dependent ferric siderophore reductase